MDRFQGKERFEAAALYDGLGLEMYTTPNAESLAYSNLRTAQDALLEYDAQFRAKKEGGAEVDFEKLILKLESAFKTPHPYMNHFAEPYVFFLVQNRQQEKAKDFIQKYVDVEMENRMASLGISPLLAYEIVLVHLPNASEEFHQKILEAVAKVDPGNCHVLKLCRIYQEMSSKRSATLDSTSSPLSRCLELLFYYLDQPAPHPLPPHLIEAWSILAEVLRVICQKGSDQEVKILVELWYDNRKDWWPSKHFWIPPDVKDRFYPELRDKALVAFLLSDTGESSFAKDVIKANESSEIESLIKQFGPYQQKLRTRFQLLLPDLKRAKYHVLK